LDIKEYEQAIMECQDTKLINGILIKNGVPVEKDRNNYFLNNKKVPIKYVLAYKLRLLKGLDYEKYYITRIDKTKPISSTNICVRLNNLEFDQYIGLVDSIPEQEKNEIWNLFEKVKNKLYICRAFPHIDNRIVIDICDGEIW